MGKAHDNQIYTINDIIAVDCTKSKYELKISKCTLVLSTKSETGFVRKFWNTPVNRTQGQNRILQSGYTGM